MGISYIEAHKIDRLYAKGLKKYTQDYLARKFHTSQSTVAKVLRGWRPKPTEEERTKFDIKTRRPRVYKQKISKGGSVYYVLKNNRVWCYTSQSFVAYECVLDPNIAPPEGNIKKIELGKNGLTYYLYDDGRVWSCSQQRLVKGSKAKKGYVQFQGQWLHRLVLTHFDREPKEGEQGRHLDGNPTHNHISNLEWGWPNDNVQDMVVHGTKGKGNVFANARMTEKTARKIISKWEAYAGDTARPFVRKAAKKTGLSETSIYNLLSGKTWRQLPRNRILKGPVKSSSADRLNEKQKAKIRRKYDKSKHKERIVRKAAEHYGVTLYAIRQIIHDL